MDRVSTLQRIVRTHEPGETVAVDVMRFGKKQGFRVRLQEREETAAGRAGRRAAGARGAEGRRP